MSSTPTNSASTSRSSPASTDNTASHTYQAPKPSWKETALGDDREGNPRNISWGAVIAGVVTFLALTLLLSLITAALGLGMADLTSDNPGEGVGIATGLWSIVTLVLALAAGGYVAGALAGRAGLIHGFLTWATSLLAAVVLAGLLVGNILGAASNILGTTTQTLGQAAGNAAPQISEQAENVDPAEASQAAEEASNQASEAAQDAQQAAQESAPEAEQAADTAAAGSLWTFAGLLIGAIIASITGLLGSRSVTRDHIKAPEVRSSRS